MGRILLTGLLAFAAWSAAERREAAVATPPAEVGAGQAPDVSSGPAGSGATPAGAAASGWQLPWAEAPEPPPDPVVLCRVEGLESAYLRVSRCDAMGGRPDEPGWSR